MFYKIEKNSLKKWEKYDFLIYAPHAWYKKYWLKNIKKSLKIDKISDKLIYDYIVHEADIWSREISLWIYKKLESIFPEKKFCLITWEVPRWFCDLNRFIENSSPSIVKNNYFTKDYYKSLENINKHIYNSKYVLHIHTMCSYNNDYKFVFDEETTDEKLRDFLEKSYKWSKREDNILTSDSLWNYYSYKKLDDKIKEYFLKQNKIIDENKAYTLETNYPVTHLIKKLPSSIIEITKWNIATDKTSHYTNTSKIVLDKEKIKNYIDILSECIIDFMNDIFLVSDDLELID